MDRPSFTRRALLQRLGLLPVAAAGFQSNAAKQPADVGSVPALTPSGPDGLQFLVYADCCSGRFATNNERNFAVVNEVVQRLSPAPQFIVFPGDHILGEVARSVDDLRGQWQYWLNKEMGWIKGKNIPIYHTTSNHNTFSRQSEEIFREVFQDIIPRNGPPGQEGLSYYMRRGDLLVVCVNTSFSGLGGHGHIESEWLDRVLTEHRDAKYKFAAGHHPIHPVNGYDLYPRWHVVPDEGRAFWQVLAKHEVMAYLCSHIIAFDVQAHDGVLQVCTGGAGTEAGPVGAPLAMPGTTEYLHIVQMAVDSNGLRYQVLDADGRRREALQWPIPEVPAGVWEPVGSERSASWRNLWNRVSASEARTCAAFWRVSGRMGNARQGIQTLVSGREGFETTPSIAIYLEGNPPTLFVTLLPDSAGGPQTWRGPSLEWNAPFAFDIVVHKGMGPGGVLIRQKSALSSLRSPSPRGAENLVWPRTWTVGHGDSGPTDRPFTGSNLNVQHTVILAGT